MQKLILRAFTEKYIPCINQESTVHSWKYKARVIGSVQAGTTTNRTRGGNTTEQNMDLGHHELHD